LTQDDPKYDARAAAKVSRVPSVTASSVPVEVPSRYGPGNVVGGKYRLVRVLGHGGMGDVWLAHNETLDIDVAVKLLRADAGSEETADRLLREARAAARLGDPAIVRVFDFGRAEFGEPYIVMELLDGEDLATLLARGGRLGATKAVRILLPIVHALGAAHAKGIVHRDLKPENIVLAKMPDGRIQPKVVDFGIAKLDPVKNVRITATGVVLGSPAYMSPEQARGEEADHRTDIWSACLVLYEMITGIQPFRSKNYNATLADVIGKEPEPLTAHEAGDDDLWTIVKRGLAKTPSHRWQSMRDLGEALAGWLVARGATEDITGSSLETNWLGGRGAAADLGTVPPPSSEAPPPLASPESDVSRALSASIPATRSRRTRAAVGVAGLALAVGVLIGVVLSLRGSARSKSSATGSSVPSAMHANASVVAPIPTPSGLASAVSAPAVASAAPPANAPSEPLVGPNPGASEARGSKALAHHGLPAGHPRSPAIRKSLKDPFQ
jgi:serine/threonine-protein kinase